jgi:hypothetical protein
VYWYQLGSGVRKLFRFEAYTVSGSAPSFLLNGVELPDGVKYYNTGTRTTYEKQALVWVPITVPGAGDISPLWREITLKSTLANIYLDIEEKLYAVSKLQLQQKFDYTSLIDSPADQDAYDEYYKQRFFAFVAERGIQAPLANVNYSASNAFSWNYAASVTMLPPRTGAAPTGALASWQALYNFWYGTAYPHLEPWAMQGYSGKPTWWDAEYLNTNPSAFGGRRWKYTHLTATGMWDNILQGVVPAGFALPDGTISTGVAGETTQYNYLAVNITDVTLAGGYEPDMLLPPYYDNTLIAGTEPETRSLFTLLNAQVAGPDADFVYGEQGPVEWLWLTSSEHVYDDLIVAFLMQPVKFFQAAFGLSLERIDELEIDTTFCHVYSHRDVLFHGDVYDTNKVFVANGLNQWYVNYNRYNGFDTNAEFRELWAGWDPQLGYQFAGIIDTETFEIFSRNFSIGPQDYNLVLSNSGVFKDLWVDAFDVSVLNIPPSVIQYNNQSQWKFSLDTLSTAERDIPYYGVQHYPIYVDAATNEFTAYAFKIIDVSAAARRFVVTGNYATVFTSGESITVSGSTGNDGNYTVQSSVYEPSGNRTRITVNQPVATSIVDGRVDVTSFMLPWNTGDVVYFFTTKMLPAPIVPDTPYFLIKTANRKFKLAESPLEAEAGTAIDIVTEGQGDNTVGSVLSTFNVFGGSGISQEDWYHFNIDRNIIKTLTPPETVYGLQQLINVIDGYVEVSKETGVEYNLGEGGEYDFDTGRSVGWQIEIERFIEYVFQLRRTRMQIVDRYECVVENMSTDEMKFTGAVPQWVSGQQIMFTSLGTLPSPLFANVPYYFVATSTPGVFKVSVMQNTSMPSAIIDITTTGTGAIFIAPYKQNNTFPSFEINPIRNNIWISTPQGILSDVINGPYTDIRTNQTIFDQYGRPLTADKMLVYRQDKQTRIAIRAEIPNDVEPAFQSLPDPYNYIHIGGCHLFVEGYEHILLLNDYTVGGALVYDPFIGLNTKKFDLDYFEKLDFNLRPTLGGFYLAGNEFHRNIEGSITDLRNYYDTFTVPELRESTRYARALLGYSRDLPYLDLVNLNSKSQFLFYRGMIQSKGSTNSVKAYINSRRFIDAKIDEFWAWKIADFGDARPRVYPALKLYDTDSIYNDLRLEFLAPTESARDADVDRGFEVVSFTDGEDTRWEIFPEQRTELKQNPLFLDASIERVERVYFGPTPPPQGQLDLVEYWYDTSGMVDATTGGVLYAANDVGRTTPIVDKVALVGDTIHYRMNGNGDAVQVIRHDLYQSPRDLRRYIPRPFTSVDGISEPLVVSSPNTIVLTGDKTVQAVLAVTLTIIGTGAADGAYTVSNATYDANTNETTVTVVETIPGTPVGGNVMFGIGLYTYADINASTVRLRRVDVAGPIPTPPNLPTFECVLLFYSMRPGADKISPSKIIDKKAQTVVANVQFWDPARGVHSYGARHNVDVFNDVDPAFYNTTLQSVNATTDRAWNDTEEGTRWVNTSSLQYVPYYDHHVYPDVNDRLTAWGNLADYGEVNVYQWVTSSVPPSEWDGRATSEESNISIPVNKRATGNARKVLYNRTRRPGGTPQVFDANVAGFTDIIQLSSGAGIANGDTVLLAADEFPLTQGDALSSGVPYYVVGKIGTDIIKITATPNGTPITFVTAGSGLKVFSYAAAPLAATILTVGNSIINVTHTLSVGDAVLIDATTFPDTTQGKLQYGVIYYVESIPTPGTQIRLSSTLSGLALTFINLGANITVTKADVATGTVIDLINDKIVLPPGHGLVEDDQVLFLASTFPTVADGTFESSIKYYVVATPSSTEIKISSDIGGDPIFFRTAGVGLQAVPAFKPVDWQLAPAVRERLLPALQPYLTAFEPTMITTAFVEGDSVAVYVNGKTRIASTVVGAGGSVSTVGTGMQLVLSDTVDVLRGEYNPTSEELEYDPDTEDDGVIHIQWKYDTPYSTAERLTPTGAPVLTYNFWIENGIIRDTTDDTSLSLSQTAIELETIPTPYFIVQKPKVDPTTVTAEGSDIAPLYYRQAVLRGLSSIVTDQDRYTWRFTRDLALRDNLDNNPRSVNLKNKHTEWLMIRKEQPSSLPRELWNRLTEAMIGYKLSDPSIRVPTLERQLYDDLNGTDTRFGLGVDQAFVDATLAKATILAYLQDPNISFSPVDIDDFFARNTFDTPTGIAAAMDEIYTSFNVLHVNRIWFATLDDALSTRAKYKELLKTSWVAMHGIRVLEVGGLFDD